MAPRAYRCKPPEETETLPRDRAWRTGRPERSARAPWSSGETQCKVRRMETRSCAECSKPVEDDKPHYRSGAAWLHVECQGSYHKQGERPASPRRERLLRAR
jgi:hypothetical protein